MAQGGIGGAARVVRGPHAKKPAPTVPDEHVPVPMVPTEHRTLLVQGLTPQISDELLELYFENPKYGGGEIESIYREDEDRARVVFKDDLGKTRMHSSRMRTVRCSSRLLGGEG